MSDDPKSGDTGVDQLMVSQLLEQNLTLGFFLKGLNGPSDPAGAPSGAEGEGAAPPPPGAPGEPTEGK